MFRINNIFERNLDITSIYLYIDVLSGIWNSGKYLIHQGGNFPLIIRLYKIMQCPYPESFQCMVCGCGGKDQKTVRIGLSKFFCNLNSICSAHINIQKQHCERMFFCSQKKFFSGFKFNNICRNISSGELTVQPSVQ